MQRSSSREAMAIDVFATPLDGTLRRAAAGENDTDAVKDARGVSGIF
jgi:hypothetical protein